MLLTHDEVYVEANKFALEEEYGSAPEGPDAPGDTAPAHTRRALRGAGFDDAEIDAGLARWCETFSERYVELLAAADTGHWEVGPYAQEAVAAVEHRALLTGNPPCSCPARMDRLGLGDLFPPGQGAFGCEREDRIALFALARERAGGWQAERTVAVGDTPLDVSTSHAAGCRCIAVTAGRFGADDLVEADLVISDLSKLGEALSELA